jgi:hypothetical protein
LIRRKGTVEHINNPPSLKLRRTKGITNVEGREATKEGEVERLARIDREA